MRDLVSTFRQVANTQGDATALIAGAAHISFADLAARAGGFAQHLHARGIRPGARVLVAMPVGIDLFVALAGAWAAGLSVVFPEPAMGLRGLRHAVSTTKPEAFLASGSYTWIKPIVPGLWRCKTLAPRGTMAPLPDAPDPSSTALISFTSGSTGRPKAIARSHAFLMAQHSAVAPLLAGAGVDLVAFPVFTLVNLAAGRTSVLPGWRLSRPEQVTPADLTRCIGASGATRALLPPSLCETLVESADLGPLHTVFTGGGPVKPQLVAALRDRGLRVVSVYGSTEAEPIAELDWADATDTDIALMQNGGGLLAGHPVPGLSLRLKDDEIQVAGAHVN
ncbi:MAG: AMP-binding protein, partial [Pseudomonadota bacterium]